MIETKSRQLIYPARRAVEHAVTVRGARPTRLFAVLWPLWRVETTAQVYDEQSYEMIDLMLVRAILEGGLTTPSEIATFLGLPESLVTRCLAFLKIIGHVEFTNSVAVVTALGRHSAAKGIRYVLKEGRQPIFVEQFTGKPLPRRYYEGAIGLLDTPEIPSDQAGDGSRFWPLFAPSLFQPELVTRLEKRTDRFDFNLPRQLRDLKVLGERTVFLPAYLIEIAGGGILAYSAIADSRDSFLESVFTQTPMIRNLIEAEPGADPRTLWTAWLADGDLRGTLSRLPNGVWRATLAPGSFGSSKPQQSITGIGSFRLKQKHFLQLWSDDLVLRRQAVVERALSIAQLREIASRSMLADRIIGIAELLEVARPTFAELLNYAKQNSLHAKAAHLQALGPD